MYKKLKISKEELRNLVKEVLEVDDMYTPGVGAVNVNAVIDPQETDTVPVNPCFTPQDKVEFEVAIRNLVRNLPDSYMPDLYDTLKKAIDEKELEEEETMKKTKNVKSKGDTVAESIIRKYVRKIIAEKYGDRDELDYGLNDDTITDDNLTLTDDELSMLDNTEELETEEPEAEEPQTFAEIAKELDFSVAGAKQAVDKALAKAEFLGQMDEDDLEIMTLNAMKDYVNYLQSSGELTDADVRLMIDHPDIIQGLDGFREYLHKYVRREMKKSGFVSSVEKAKTSKKAKREAE